MAKAISKEKITKKEKPLLVSVFDTKGEVVSEMELPEEFFGQKVNNQLLSQAVRVHLASARAVGAETKTRAQVAGGGAKPWKQKGTGRARAGSIRSPLWRGGGIIHGPHQRDFSLDLPKKMRQAALKSALSAKAASKDVTILNKLELKEEKTKIANGILKKLPLKEKIFVVVEEAKDLRRAFRNLPKVELADYRNLNTFSILNHDSLVFTKDAVEKITEFYGQKKETKNVA